MLIILLFNILLFDCIKQSTSDSYVINSIDFNVEQFRRHRTVQFYNDYTGERNVIVRRGDHFSFSIDLIRQFNNEQIEIQLTFVTKRDAMVISLPHRGYGWTMKQSVHGRRVSFDIKIPGNAPVGVWKLRVFFKNNYGAVISEIESPNPIVVLFNPWSPEDAVYFPEVYKLSEYILNERGYSYHYKFDGWEKYPWIYGQFQPSVLDAVLFVLDRATLTAAQRADVVLVSRELTYLMNDDGVYNRGVLQGKWKEPYGTIDGRPSTKPWEWTGSPSILKQYFLSHGKTVGYGQCWVFAGILITSYRALGIPSRSVSNFLSAKSKFRDLTLDIHLDNDGFIKKRESDGLWNYHVWVQAWFARRDLGYEYGGWQELDSTPQEFNDGRFQVGPAANTAIRNSKLRQPFESDFIYEELNADEVVWSADNKIVSINHDKVGLMLLTKRVGSDDHEDITSLYKPREGTAAERASYRAAADVLGLRPPSLKPMARSTKKAVTLTFEVSQKIAVGSSILVKLHVKNPSMTDKKLRIGIKATSMYYNGIAAADIKLRKHDISIRGAHHEIIKFVINPEEYFDKLQESYTIRLEAFARGVQSLVFEKKFISLITPTLMINGPKSVNLNESFSLAVQFKNPLRHKLRNCHIVVEGNGIDRTVFKVNDIDPLSIGKSTLKLRSLYPNMETIVINMYANNLKEMRGSLQLKVNGKRKHKFAMYRLTKRKVIMPPIKSIQNAVNNFMTQTLFDCCKMIEF